jgi:hypothetical protein
VLLVHFDGHADGRILVTTAGSIFFVKGSFGSFWSFGGIGISGGFGRCRFNCFAAFGSASNF